MSLSNKDILIKANAMITNGDNEGFLAFCAEDVFWEFVGDQTLSGKQAVREYMKSTYKQPPKFDVDHLITEDNYVTAIGKISLHDAAGKLTHYEYCDVWRFHNGKMAQLKAFVVQVDL
jgi:ketosteroid isomerase-like protein